MRGRGEGLGPSRWLGVHQRAAAALLFAGLVLVYLWPVLVGGKVLSPATILDEFVPWQGRGLPGRFGYYNRLLTDVVQSIYPWNVLARGFIREGVFPAWSQHAFAGTPFYANAQTVLLSPFSLPLWILPLNYGVGVSAALKLWVAGFGAYLLARELRVGFWPAVLAGVSFALCAFNVVWLSYETLPSVAAMLPWMLLLVERTVRRGSPGAALGLALATLLAITGGHPGTEVHVLFGAVLWGVVRVWCLPALATRVRLQRVGLVTGGVVLGAALAAVLWIPELRGASGTVGAVARKGGAGGLPGAHLGFDALRAAVLPDWWGRPSDGLLSGPANYNERAFFAGSVAAVLALLALTTTRAWRRTLPFAVLGAFGLAVALHMPLYGLVERVPGLDAVQNQRMLLYFAFAVAMLSAFGLEQLLDRGAPAWRLWAIFGAAAGLGALAIGSAGGAHLGQALADAFGTARHEAAGVLALASALWWLAIVAALAVCAALACRRSLARAVAVLVVLLAAVDMLHFAAGYQPMGPARGVFPPRTPAIAYLQAHRDDGRIVGLDDALLNDWGAIYGLRDIRGYDPPQPSGRFLRLWQVIAPEQTAWRPFEAPGVGPEAEHVMSLLGARYWVADPGLGVAPTLRPSVHIGYSGPDATVLVNTSAVPRAFVPATVTPAREERETLAAIVAPTFDARRQAVIEDGGTATANLAAGTGPPGTVHVTAETNSTVTLHADMRQTGLVVLDDALAPGWHVTVDGHAQPAIRTDDVLRGVIVDPGQHEIRWGYRVPGLRLGVVVSALALIVLAVAAYAVRHAARRPRRRADRPVSRR